jgi:hypothetical protein
VQRPHKPPASRASGASPPHAPPVQVAWALRSPALASNGAGSGLGNQEFRGPAQQDGASYEIGGHTVWVLPELCNG